MPKSKPKIIFTLIILFSLFVVSVSIRAGDPVPVIAEYFDMLETRNFETASMMWAQECQERALRFGIEYLDIPVRVDCSSPIVNDLDFFRNYMYQPVKQYKSFGQDRYDRLEYSQIIEGVQYQHYYWVKLSGEYFWLIYPQDYYTRDWPVKETKYFRVHYHPDNEKFLNPVLFDESDRFIENLADILKITKPDLETIAQKKIEFYYCNNDSMVTEITNQVTKGLFDVASNDIISANFPHFHELTHFMINYKLRRLPLFTLPVLQEGLAVYYGGRWGKKPSALFDLGIFIYREKFVELDSILTMDGFKANSAADISYPVVAIFTSYLMNKLGQNNYFKLYLELSGKYRDLKKMTATDIQNIITRAVGMKSWPDLMAEFNRYLDKTFETAKVADPGRLDDGKVVISAERFNIRKNNKWLAFEFTGHDDTLQGSLFFGHDERLVGASSPLFEEQFQGSVPFEGYRYAVRFDRNEAGLYDYGTNELVAKFIWGITPLEGYYDSVTNSINIKFKADILGKAWPEFNDYKFLPL